MDTHFVFWTGFGCGVITAFVFWGFAILLPQWERDITRQAILDEISKEKKCG